MQKGNSVEFAKRDALRMLDESARGAGKECAEMRDGYARRIFEENVVECGKGGCGMLDKSPAEFEKVSQGAEWDCARNANRESGMLDKGPARCEEGMRRICHAGLRSGIS